jgi:hypothetical protein
MAEELTSVIWNHKGRACIVTKQERVRKPQVGGKFRGTYDRLTVEYLDGLEPRLGLFGLLGWGKQARKMKGAQALVWRRVRELVAEGMDVGRAQVQATSELTKGILSEVAPASQAGAF